MSENEERARVVEHWLARAQESLASAADELVQTGKLPAEMGQLYNELFDERHDADYEPFFEVDPSVVKERLQGAAAFMRHVCQLLGRSA